VKVRVSNRAQREADRHDTWWRANLVRRVLMKKTERHVYYGHLGDEVIILAVWGARRGRGPRL
jgi:hypothetical protein